MIIIHQINICKNTPCTNKASAALREEFGLKIANGCRLDSPIFGTHVPKGREQIGSCNMGNELAECLKYLQTTESKDGLS